jgi:hypothetical protein
MCLIRALHRDLLLYDHENKGNRYSAIVKMTKLRVGDPGICRFSVRIGDVFVFYKRPDRFWGPDCSKHFCVSTKLHGVTFRAGFTYKLRILELRASQCKGLH